MDAGGDAVLKVIIFPLVCIGKKADVAVEEVFALQISDTVALRGILRGNGAGHHGRVVCFNGCVDSSVFGIKRERLVDKSVEIGIG